MRTGAIFARGSCRALKWMALFGVVFALGAGSAAAQATFSGAEWTPESDKLKINMSAAVWSRSPNDAAKDFTVTWGTPTVTATGTMSDIPSERDDAKTSFIVTLDKVIPTGAGGADGATGITVTYTAPTDADDVNDRGILDNSADHTATADGTPTVTEAAVDPKLPDLEAKTLRKDVALTATTAIQLPTAMGNQPFTYLASDLPSGLTFDADGADDAAGGTGLDADRLIVGTPDTAERTSVRYVVTDRNSRSVSGTFMITVNDVPDAPAAPTATPTTNMSESLDVMWTAPDDNYSAILYYQVRHREEDGTWSNPPMNVLSGTSQTFTGLTNGTTYEFEVRAINGVGMSGWSDTGMGTPMASGAVPDAPAAPTVTATANTQGSLDVMWVAPNANGSAITGYGLRYRVKDSANWTVMTAVLPATPTSTTLAGMPNSTTYEVQVNAQNANGASDWSASGEGTTAAPPITRALRGQLTKFELTGKVDPRTIGGVSRLFVKEGEQDLQLEVTVTWTHEEIAQIGYGVDQWVFVAIKENRAAGPPSGAGSWLSWIDDESDVHFPQLVTRDNQGWGNLGGWVRFTTPKSIPAATRGSARHTTPVKGTLPVLVLHDNYEAESDAFYIEAVPSTLGDVDLNATAAVNKITPEVAIIDDEEKTQKITVKGPKEVYESAGSAEYTLSVDLPRVELPLDVILAMEKLDGVSVSDAQISLSDTSLEIGPGASAATVTVHLPASDMNRKDDPYQLQPSVRLYSLSSGVFETIKTNAYPITVIDVHKLPWLTVEPAEAGWDMRLKEGASAKLKLKLDRNPRDTRAVDPETREYTSEPIDVMVDMLPEGIEIMPRPVKFAKYSRKAGDNWMQEMQVEVTATPNENLDGDRMVTLTFEARGTEAKNGMGSGEGDKHMAVATLTVEDDTKPLVWAREDVSAQIDAAKMDAAGDDMIFSKGEMIKLADSDMFGWEQGVSVGLDPKSDNPDVVKTSVSGGMLTVTAEGEGMAMVTVTARASRPASGATIVDQTDPREATITFMVEVGLVALTIELKGPEDNMNLVEGGMPHANGTPGSAMLTATANRPVSVDTTVMLKRDRAMSSASDADYEAEDITIPAGQMTGSTMVTAVDDGMMENAENMPEELVLYGMTEDNSAMVSGQVKLYLWDAAVPALPVIAQLLLAAFLAVGGYRRYRRR